jgi:hypothetical protein
MIGLGARFWQQSAVAPNTNSLSLDSSLTQSARWGGANNEFSIGGTTLSMEQWLKHTDLSGTWQVYQAVWSGFGAGAAHSYACGYEIGEPGSFFLWLEDATGFQDIVGWTGAPAPGVWTHYAFTWDAALVGLDRFHFLINGVDQGVPDVVTTNDGIVDLAPAATPYTIGDFSSASILAASLNGLTDESRLWTTARSAAEVLANYNKQIDPATAGLRDYYQWNGSVYTDVTAGRNLAGVNAPVFSVDVPFA